MTSATLPEIRTASCDAIGRGFDQLRDRTPREPRLLFQNAGLNLLSRQNKRDKHRHAASVRARRSPRQSVTAVNQFFDGKQQVDSVADFIPCHLHSSGLLDLGRGAGVFFPPRGRFLDARHWLELRQRAKHLGRPLACPLCRFHFAYRHYSRAGRTCPQCETPLGFPFYYRLILFVAYLILAGWTMYRGYQTFGQGWLLLGLPFAAAAGLIAQGMILRSCPPKLAAHAEGNTWLNLK
jgi:hypothetical protein